MALLALPYLCGGASSEAACPLPGLGHQRCHPGHLGSLHCAWVFQKVPEGTRWLCQSSPCWYLPIFS